MLAIYPLICAGITFILIVCIYLYFLYIVMLFWINSPFLFPYKLFYLMHTNANADGSLFLGVSMCMHVYKCLCVCYICLCGVWVWVICTCELWCIHPHMQRGQRRMLGSLTCHSISYFLETEPLTGNIPWLAASKSKKSSVSSPHSAWLHVHSAMPGFYYCCLDAVIWT